MTLTQLVIHRFRVVDQDNADLLDVYAGFYTAGPRTGTFNETNEVRLHGNDVLTDFWSIDFSAVYNERLTSFWNESAADFRTLAKCNFLINALRARDRKKLSDADFNVAVTAVMGPVTWPVSLQMLQTQYADTHAQVRMLDVAGYLSNNIVRIKAPKGRQILYLPGEAEAFKVLETETDMHFWVLLQMNDEARRQAFMAHFSMADRQDIADNLPDLMNRLVGSWSVYDHQLINQENRGIDGDVFSWLRNSTKAAMSAEAALSLTSNGDLREKLWIGYLSAGVKVFGPMAVVGWPVALPVIGASIANMGLNIDQAVNGKTAEERKASVLGAVLSGIDILFNLLVLKGPGSLEEAGPEIDAAEAKEMAELKETTPATKAPKPAPTEIRMTPGGRINLDTPLGPAYDSMTVDNLGELKQALIENGMQPMGWPPVTGEAEGAASVLEDLAQVRPEIQLPNIPQHWQANELLEGITPETTPGKFQGIYRLDGNPSTAITLNDAAWYVRYEADANGVGTWAIIDPENPNAFSGSLPVRLNAQGEWELAPRAGLKGGGNNPKGMSPGVAQPQPQITLRKPTTSYDAPQRYSLRKLAMGKPETHVKVSRLPDGTMKGITTYDEYVAAPRAELSRDARSFFARSGFSTSLPTRPALPAVTPSTTATELIEQALDAANGLVIGESQDRIASMRFLIENMPTLARQGVKTLYFHRLLNDFSQLDLNTFFSTGEMSDDLEETLQQLQSDPSGRYTPLEVVRAARLNGIRVQATDCLASYRYPTSPLPDMHEQAIKSYLTHTIMQANESLNGAGKWVVLTDQENINTFRGMAGISEIQGGIGLRIEEVLPEQHLLIESDRGIEVGRGFTTQPDHVSGEYDTLYADLSLQMPLPLLERTPAELNRLLFRQGMFTFEKVDGTWTLIHRGRDRHIARTLVERTVDGKYLINRPTWTDVHQVPYASIVELSWALSRMGMDLEGRLPL